MRPSTARFYYFLFAYGLSVFVRDHVCPRAQCFFLLSESVFLFFYGVDLEGLAPFKVFSALVCYLKSYINGFIGPLERLHRTDMVS